MRIELQRQLNPRRQPVKAFPHAGHAACQVDTDIARYADHDSADKTRRSAISSTAPVKRSFTPVGSSTSIIPSTRRSGSGASASAQPALSSVPAVQPAPSHWRKSSQLTRAKPTPPGVKLAAADPV